jgi:trehalose/maltose transport system permease protein
MAQASSVRERPADGGEKRSGVLSALRSEFRDKDRRLAYYMVAPAVLIIVGVAIFPILYAAVLSFQRVIPEQPSVWVGFDNYTTMFGDEVFRTGLVNTAIFTVISVSIETVFGMLIALALNRVFVGRSAARAIAIAPWAFPTAILAIMWRLMFQDGVGILQYIATTLHLYTGPILGSSGALLVAAIIVDVWKTVPFMALLILAGLQVIPRDVYEAARVDGATAQQQFWRITLPLVKPALLVAVLFRTLDAWRIYDLFWVMGSQQLDSLSTFVYQNVRLSQIYFSIGNAGAVFVFLSSLLIALVFLKGIGTRAQG